MPTLVSHYTTWLDLTVELARHGPAAFPRREIADQLAATSGCSVSWHWIDADGRFGFELRDPVPGFPEVADPEMWTRDGMRLHPLTRWYAHTGDPAPMTVGRVPRAVASDRGFQLVREYLSPLALDQQLCIPYRMTAGTLRAFLLARGREDYDDDQFELTRRIQPLLALLERQSAVLDPRLLVVGHAVGLTSREVAVLRLLAEGLTAEAIGRRLLVSPRTVHAHLRSIYRKLGVTDRMRAVLVAQEAGLLHRCLDDHPSPVTQASPYTWSGVSTQRLLPPVARRGVGTTEPPAHRGGAAAGLSTASRTSSSE